MLLSILFMNKFTINEFIEHTKRNKLNYICYCEVIIDPLGNIIESKPCHTETVIEYAMEKENKSKEEIKNEIPLTCLPLEYCVDKYGLIAVWYCGYMYSEYKKGPNRFQSRSLDILIKHDLITEDYVRPAAEYKNYLYRKSLGIEK